MFLLLISDLKYASLCCPSTDVDGIVKVTILLPLDTVHAYHGQVEVAIDDSLAVLISFVCNLAARFAALTLNGVLRFPLVYGTFWPEWRPVARRLMGTVLDTRCPSTAGYPP